ncbi:MAG: MBL fold metallo-hydrolase [Planctomycetota bacterium]
MDQSCIDCDACRWIAEGLFERVGDASAVVRQPVGAHERQAAALALVACPTASIGGASKEDVLAARRAFPVPLATYGAAWGGAADGDSARVLHAGYHAESSFGAASWFVQRPERGNVLIDSPRWSQPLVERLEALGGVDWILLTHRDDVADHARFQEHFGATRVLHADDVRAGEAELAGVERLVRGDDAIELDDEWTLLPVPGHTRGSVVFLWRQRFLFSGDHLAWSPKRRDLVAFRSACWFDWDVQTRSMERLVDVDFEWVLPGHGRLCRLDEHERRARMTALVAWMRER